VTAYYNEFDSFAADWLEELIKDGLIPPGWVDRRPIQEVKPDEIKEFTQCHFFAGIGGWAYALRLAGWPDDRPVWTGSPPCQPFSTAGKRKGKDDERHLWPVFFSLIQKRAPNVLFGEQVASAIKPGWLDDLQDDLEGEGYAVGSAVLPACSVGAPHKRDRLFFVANAELQQHPIATAPGVQKGGRDEATNQAAGRDALAHSTEPGLQVGSEQRRTHAQADGAVQGQESAGGGGLGDAERLRRCRGEGAAKRGKYDGEIALREKSDNGPPGVGETWDSSTPIYCRDGKHRIIPIEPALFPLANGIPNRVGTLRGAGNAIVPQVAAEVIKAFMEY
jgi:DNA (cytosine-5)-methyltransferase 1